MVALVSGAVIWWRWPEVAAEPTVLAQGAYGRGEWREAIAQALKALKEDPSDTKSRRTLARAWARLGRDDTAQELFGRLGEESMEAEDYFLLGAGLVRQEKVESGLAVLERARKLDRSHAETLHELARLYARLDRLGDAEFAASQLAKVPGWEGRGGIILGMIRQERGDPSGAGEAFDRALRADPELRGAAAPPRDVQKLLARALLQTSQPGRAKELLQPLIAKRPDPEAWWLLSRALLQERDMPKAALALAKAEDYGEDDPLRPEPAPYVGSKKCAPCHSANYRAEQQSRHGRTFLLPKDLADLSLPQEPVQDPMLPNVTHTFSREGETIRLKTQTKDGVRSALVDDALGSGDRGLTMLGRDDEGKARVFRISLYADRKIWDITPNARPPDRSDPGSVLGRYLSEDAVAKCVECHVTTLRAARDRKVPEAADHGIGCERCHGPGGNHLTAAEANFSDMAIARPRLASAAQIIRLCGACHDSDDPSIPASDPRTVRFQTTTMPKSRCYTESAGGLSCLTCHDPHRDAETSPAHYEARCLACHAPIAPQPSRATRHATLPEGVKRTACPVNPASDCLKCHMPTTTTAAPHTTFTDHHIRVHESPSR
jgi:tetratricopeptide (TPR) repeat protein